MRCPRHRRKKLTPRRHQNAVPEQTKRYKQYRQSYRNKTIHRRLNSNELQLSSHVRFFVFFMNVFLLYAFSLRGRFRTAFVLRGHCATTQHLSSARRRGGCNFLRCPRGLQLPGRCCTTTFVLNERASLSHGMGSLRDIFTLLSFFLLFLLKPLLSSPFVWRITAAVACGPYNH